MSDSTDMYDASEHETGPYRRLLDAERALAATEGDPEALIHRLHQAMDAQVARTLPPRATVGAGKARGAASPRNRSWSTGIVAGLVVALGAFGLWQMGARVPGQAFATAAGQQSTVTLRDGTHVTLGPSTRLSVSPGFGVGRRVIQLDGEALFAVKHDSRHPLVVRTAYGDIDDIGTVFDVRAYAVDHDAGVAVIEGAVSIHGIQVSATDEMTIDGAKALTLRHGVNLAPYVGWAQGEIAFDDAPLNVVVRTLSRRFDLDITIADSSLRNVRVTEQFTNQDVETILKDIAFITRSEYERTGRKVVIRRARVPAARVAPDRSWHPLVNTVVTDRNR